MNTAISAPLPAKTNQKPLPVSGHPERIFSLVQIAVWWAVLAGLVEGVGLVWFQEINWQRWGAMRHVTPKILWISITVDVLFFVAAALLVAMTAHFVKQIPALRVTVLLLAFLTVYDWLKLTDRLTQRACFLLALGCAVAFGRWFSNHRPSVLNMWRKSAPWFLVVWFAIFATLEGSARMRELQKLSALPAARAGAPNVLLIVVDTLRADHLSAYGYSRPTTPVFDRTAAEGVLFENAFSASSWTLPSHGSLLTGRYPADHGLQNVTPRPWLAWRFQTLRGYPTLGEALQRKGYRTGAFSANQLYFTSNVGLGRGFIHFEDYYQSPWDMLLRTLYGREFDRVFLHRTEKSKITKTVRALGFGKLLDNRKAADRVNREALAWIDKGHQPFFAVLNYIDVHDARWLQWLDHVPAFGHARTVDQYDSAVNYVDQEIGDMLSKLKLRGLDSNTLVIITADHGEGLGQHEMQYHGIGLYRETIHVPLLIWYPGHIPASVRVARPVSNASIAATIMDIVDGHDVTFPGQGLDQLWSRAGNDATWPDPISELQKNGIDDLDTRAREVEPTALDGDMKSVVTAQWHFIVHEKLGEQLFDWVHDPGETQNLINTGPGKQAEAVLRSKIQKQSAP